MYGSVSALDVVRLFEEEKIQLERRHVLLPHPIKALGEHRIQLKLKEGIPAEITLHIIPEGGFLERFPSEEQYPES